MVDGVDRVVHLTPDDIEPPPAFGDGAGRGVIRGMARIEDRFVVLLDLSVILSGPEASVLEQVAAEGAAISSVSAGEPVPVPVPGGA
jgi:purine-binding chemotaxis protein CheW